MTTTAIVTDALHTWAETMSQHVYFARMDLEDRAYRASLTPAQLRDFRVHVGELAESCPACGAAYPELEGDEHPDMVGTTYTTTYTCCGHSETFNDALEYRNGVPVDIR